MKENSMILRSKNGNKDSVRNCDKAWSEFSWSFKERFVCQRFISCHSFYYLKALLEILQWERKRSRCLIPFLRKIPQINFLMKCSTSVPPTTWIFTYPRINLLHTHLHPPEEQFIIYVFCGNSIRKTYCSTHFIMSYVL